MLTMMLLKRKLEGAQAKRKQGILLDGFPRSVQQLEAFNEQVSTRNFVSDRPNPHQISSQYSTIVLDCPDATLFQRLSSRAISSGREDDNQESIRLRVETFKESNQEILQLLSKNQLRTVSSRSLKVGNIANSAQINCAGPVEEVRVLFKRSMQDIILSRNTS